MPADSWRVNECGELNVEDFQGRLKAHMKALCMSSV